jgi:phosphoribosylamine--glycine ligase
MCDGVNAALIASAQDHKRAFDDDRGPNTGGMGAYSPVPFVTEELNGEVQQMVRSTLRELVNRNAEFRGVLFCGLMVTPDGPKVLEYNVRFGDPECQVIVPRFVSDLYAHLREAAEGRFTTPFDLQGACVGVALASEGYPPAPVRKGDVIDGLARARARDGVHIFHAGTAVNDARDVVTNGGRVLTVVGAGADVCPARDRAYTAVADITWPGMHYRRDIGAKALT